MTHTGVSVNSVRGFICCMFVHICYNNATWLFRFSVSQNMQQSTSMWLLATVSYLTPWMTFCQSFFKYLDHEQCFYIQPKWHQIALHQLNKHWEAFGTVHDLPTLVGGVKFTLLSSWTYKSWLASTWAAALSEADLQQKPRFKSANNQLVILAKLI